MADLVSMKVNIDGAVGRIKSLQEDQLPFIIARSLTAVAGVAQGALRVQENSVFRLRNDWTVRGTRITPATKTKLLAEVYTDTSNRKTGAPDYLLRQDDGGERVPVNGRHHIAIPTKYLLAMVGGGVIPDELRPKAMLGYVQNGGKLIGRTGKLRGASAAVRGMFFFLVTLKKGGYAILGRTVNDRDAYPMYLLVTTAQIKATLDAEPITQAVIDSNFEAIFDRIAKEVGVTVSA